MFNAKYIKQSQTNDSQPEPGPLDYYQFNC